MNLLWRTIRASVVLVFTLTCATACASQHAAPPRAASPDSAAGSNAPSIPTPSSQPPSLRPPSSPGAAPNQLPSPSYETQTATPAAPTGAFPHPPDTPCVYPADASPADSDGFVGGLRGSDLVVEADVEDKFQQLTQVGDQVFWSQLLDNVDVLRSRINPPTTVTGLIAEGDPGKPPYGWTPGRYVLLLFGIENGVSSVSSGMAGMFRIVDGRALRFCPNYDDPAHPIAASGAPPTLDELLALIPPQLPIDSVAPKPTTTPTP